MSDTGPIAYSKDLVDAVCKFGQLLIPANSPELALVLTQIAHTGLTCYPWQYLSLLLADKIEERLFILQTTAPVDDFVDIKTRLRELLVALPGPPFTLQRLCELAISPDRWGYTTMKRYVHAVEKVLSVTSYQDTLSPEQYSVMAQMQYESMRTVKEMRRFGSNGGQMGEEDAGPIQTPFPGQSPSGLPDDPSSALQHQQQLSQQPQEPLEPHTDTPIVASSEEPLFVTSPSSDNPNSSSAMDVDS